MTTRNAKALGFGVELEAEVVAFDGHAEDVFEGEVALVDVHGGGGWDDVVIAEIVHPAAAVAGEANGDDVHLAGLFEGADRMEALLAEVGWKRLGKGVFALGAIFQPLRAFCAPGVL